MTSLDPAAVVAASNAWVWYPPDAEVVRTDDFLLIRFPDTFPQPLQVVRMTPSTDLAAALDGALAEASRFGLPHVEVWVRMDAPEGLDALLAGRGGVPEETLDVLALDLTAGVPDLGQVSAPAEVEVRWQTDVATAREAAAVWVDVFGGAVPDDAEIARRAAASAESFARGEEAVAVASVEGRAAGHGGVSVVDGVARLWDGGVRADARRRGVYRAVLRARLAWAVEQGATMALVKGRVETSGPILRRAGFAVFGQERSYLLPLPSQE